MANGLQLQARPYATGYILQHYEQRVLFLPTTWGGRRGLQRNAPVRPSARFEKPLVRHIGQAHLLPCGADVAEERLCPRINIGGQNLLGMPVYQSLAAPWLRAEGDQVGVCVQDAQGGTIEYRHSDGHTLQDMLQLRR